MSNLVIVGTQWGDEGKGKCVDLSAQEADVVVRYGGGNNAGHTLVVNGQKIILHLIPSAVIHTGKTLVLGNHMVLDTEELKKEISNLQKLGLLQDINETLKISNQAHIILPYHVILDRLRELNKGGIGTTGRGIGPAYEFKAARCGIRMEHLKYPKLLGRLVTKALEKANPEIERLGGDVLERDAMINYLLCGRRYLAQYVRNTNTLVSDSFSLGKNILFEAAQGAALDVDHGTVPFVTSSTTISSAAASGSGIGPMHINEVVGVVKAYLTRVGEGPFPTELYGEEAEQLRRLGAEYGATTGRPRRVGWLDLVQLKYAIQINGIKKLFWTKLDVLSGLGTIYVCIAYKYDGKIYTNWGDIPTELLDKVEPQYIKISGFDHDISGARTMDELGSARELIDKVSELLNVGIAGVSVGPDREQTIPLDTPFSHHTTPLDLPSSTFTF